MKVGKMVNKLKIFAFQIQSGCSGNGNKFESLAECREKCGNFVPKEAGGHEGHGMVLPVRECTFFESH